MKFDKEYIIEYNGKQVRVTASNIDEAREKASYKLAGARRNYIDYLVKNSIKRA